MTLVVVLLTIWFVAAAVVLSVVHYRKTSSATYYKLDSSLETEDLNVEALFAGRREELGPKRGDLVDVLNTPHVGLVICVDGATCWYLPVGSVVRIGYVSKAYPVSGIVRPVDKTGVHVLERGLYVPSIN